MNWENICFFLFASSTLLVAFHRLGWNSFVSLGLLGTYIYATPAMIGAYNPIHLTLGARADFMQPSTGAMLVQYMVWVTFLPFVFFIPAQRVRSVIAGRKLESLVRAAAVMTLLGYLFIGARLGFLYFFNQRSETDLGLVSVLWRWVPVFGVLLSIRAKKPAFILFFAFFLLIYAISGDRTMPAIAFGTLLLNGFLSSERRRFLPGLTHLMFGLVGFILLLLWKPIYLFVKNPSMAHASDLFNLESLKYSLMSFEPLGQFSLIELAVENELEMPFGDFITAVAGNILVFPSIFGINSNYFNEFITESVVGQLTFGIAGNYFAHAYVALGFMGVSLFAAIFLMSLFFLQRAALNKRGLGREICIISGSVIAVYAHRNGLDNLLSFVRQIIIVAVSLHLYSFFDSYFSRIRYRSFFSR